MAEIDAGELERAVAFLERDATLLAAETLPAYVALGPVLAAAKAHLASLKGELEEARAELVFGNEWAEVTLYTNRAGYADFEGRGPTEAAAIRAALSRARGPETPG